MILKVLHNFSHTTFYQSQIRFKIQPEGAKACQSMFELTFQRENERQEEVLQAVELYTSLQPVAS